MAPQPLEGAPVDHRSHEVPEVGDVAHPNVRDHRRDPLAHLGPERIGDVRARRGAALLPLVFVGAPHHAHRERVDVRARVRDDEVLAAGLPDDPGVAAVAVEILRHRAPETPEYGGGSGEVNAGQLLVREQRTAHRDRVTRQEVDDAGRQSGLLQDAIEKPVAQGGRGRRLPDHRVPHQRRRGRQVAADRREVERRDGVDEPFERPVIHPVPHAGGRLGLLPVDLVREMHVVAEEVDQLAGAVDLGLECRLALAQHGGGVDDLTVRGGEQVGGLEEDGGAILEAPVRPVPLGLDRGLGGRCDRRRVGLMHLGEHAAMAVRRDHVVRVSGADLPAAHDHRDVHRLGRHGAQRGLERGPLGSAGRVGQHRLVVGNRDVRDATHRGAPGPGRRVS